MPDGSAVLRRRFVPLLLGLALAGCGAESPAPDAEAPTAPQQTQQARPQPPSASAPTPRNNAPRPQGGPPPPPPNGADPNAPPPLNFSDPNPGAGENQSPYTSGPSVGPPTDAINRSSFQQSPALQPDPGPAPATPEPDSTGCDTGMVRIETGDGPICIHQYEVSIQLKQYREGMIRQFIHQPELLKLVSEPGQFPSIVSWHEAKHICSHFGYRMCTSTEWEDVCDGVPGEGGGKFPVIEDPDKYVPGSCVFTHTQQGGMVPLQRTGTKPWCVTPTGVYDLLGNVWEWTDPEVPPKDGRPVTDKRGGAHYSRGLSTCTYPSVGTHGPDWLGSVGFRCCVDAR